MKDVIQLHDKKFRIMIPAEEIDRAVSAVAQRINSDYADKETPLFVGVLNGSFMFMSDLIKKIEFNNELSFVKLSSYEGTSSTGEVKSLLGLNNPIEGRHVIIVEDVIDSGLTLKFISKNLESRGPRSLEIAALVRKDLRDQADISCKYQGFACGDDFIVGYGLDFAERYRNLSEVCILDPKVYA